MAGTKRHSEDNNGISTRPTKTAKLNTGKTTTKGSKGKSKSKVIQNSKFKSEALPIHVNFTHTPAAVIESEEEQTTPSDPGYIGGITLLPTDFSTGSYGWKGARRLTIELQGSEGKEKESVQVMINVNATVIGSKEAPDGPGTGEDVNDNDGEGIDAAT
ncbi:hypothetical protein K439DRAFT_1611906 [Ramaria rubella]|nr:hypothetical protein K439DRAFT_1611906 [Ramaria rubella]